MKTFLEISRGFAAAKEVKPFSSVEPMSSQSRAVFEPMSSQSREMTVHPTSVPRIFMRIATLVLLLTLGVGQIWAVTFTGGKIYFRNDVTNWSTSNIQIFAHQSGYTWVSSSMSAVPNTKLYYVNASCNWGGFVSYRICGNSSAWGSGSFTNQNGSTKYTGANSSYGLNSGSIYLITPANANNGCAISPAYYSSNDNFLKYTATAKVKTSTNGSSYTTVTSGTWPATVNIKGTYLSGDGATTRTDVATSSGASGTYDAVATGLITMTYSSLSSDYAFAGWGTGDTPSSTSESYEYNIGAATTVYAFFKKKYTVTFDANGHGSAPSSQTIVAGAKASTPSEPSETGYTFGGWYKESSCTNAWNFSSDVVTAATTLYAKWTAKTPTINFNQQGGSGGSSSVTATYDAAMPSATMPTLDGYTFGGYYSSVGGSGTKYYNADGSSAKTCDLESTTTLYAKWTQSITLDEQGATTSGTTSKSVTYNSNAGMSTMITRPSKTGYDYGGYYTGVAGSGSMIVGTTGAWQASVSGYTDASKKWIKASGATTIYAKWTQTVTLNANTDYHGSGTNKSATATWNGTALSGFTATSAATGYTLIGYYSAAYSGTKVLNADGTFAGSNVSSYITSGKWTKSGATTLYAHMQAKTYSVTLDKNGGDSGGSTTATYNSNSLADFSGASYEGYSCDGYFTDADGGTKIINADGTLVSETVSGWLSSGYWVKDAADITLYAHWTEDATYYTLHYTYGTGLSARFSSIAATKTSGGDAVADNASLASGTGVTLTATPADHYKFVGWYSAAGCASNTLVSTDNPYNFSISDNTNLYAKAELMTTAITLNANGGAGGTTSVTATHGSRDLSASITKPTRTGYTLQGWYTEESGGTKVIMSTGYTASSASGYTDSGAYWIYTGSSLTLYAHWTANTYKVTFDKQSGSGGSDNVTATYNAAMPSATMPTRTGYDFNGYFGSTGGSGTKYYNADGSSAHVWDVASATTIYADWTIKNYSITYSPSSAPTGCTYTTKPTNANYNTTVDMVITPSTGYTVSVSAVDASSNTVTVTPGANNHYTFTQPASNVTVTVAATETKSTITVTTATSSQGTLKFGSTSKSWGSTASLGVATTQSITATAAAGFSFVRWDLSGAAVSASTLTNATITLKADGSGSTGTATAVFAEDLSSPWIVAGGNKIVTTGTTWRTTADANNTMLKKTGHSTENVVYFTVPVTTVCSGDNNENFQFKIYNTSTSKWYGLFASGSYYLLKAEDGTEKSLVEDNQNIELRAYVTGDYEFKLDYSTSTPKLTVNWPVYNQLRFYSARTGGSGTDTYDFTTASSPWTKTLSLAASTTYWFKVVENSEFFGNTGTMTRENCSDWTMSNTTENCGITTDFAGDYTFSYNPTNNQLSVTYPAAYKLTYSIGSVAGTSENISTSPATSSGSEVISGTNVTLTAPAAKAGYAWKGWYTDAAGTTGHIDDTNRAITVNMNADKTLYACYTENDYTVTVVAGEHGSVASASVTGHVATKVTLPTATPEVGYYFTGWTTTTGTVTYTNQSSATSAQVNGLTAAATVQANFARTYAYIQGRMTVYNSARTSETHTASAKGGWDEGSTRIEMTFDETNHEFYRHTYKTPAELKAQIGGNDQWFSIATSTTSGSMANKKTYHPSANQDLTTAGTQYTTQTSTTTYNYRFNNSTTDGYAILHFNESKVWYTLEHTLKYDANGGTGSAPATVYYLKGTNATAAAANTFTREGYTFSGWKTAASSGTSYAAGANVPMNSNITLYAQWTPKQTTVSFNANTSAEGYGSGSAPSSVTANFGVAMPSISIGVTAQNGYGCIGYFDDPVNGTQYYDGTGASVKNWDKTDATATLYAHYKKAEITAQSFSPSSIVEEGTALTVTVTVDPTPTGSTYICWRLLQNNGNPVASQPEFTWDNSNKELTFRAPATGGTYKLEATLRLGGNDCSGTVLDKDTANFVVANDHTVTVLYKCGDVTIKSSTEAPAKPTDWTSITAPDIIGYSFSKWKAGDGVTIEDADANGEKASATINYKAIYDGTLTAIYTQKRMIYFYNTLGWSDVYVYFYKDAAYWDNSKGTGTDPSYYSGSHNSAHKGHMQPIEEGSSIYYFDAEGAFIPADYTNVAFTEKQQDNCWYFYDNNKVARRGDYKSTMPLFVPLSDQPEVKKNGNTASYYCEGYWMNYPENTGYTLKIYNNAYATKETDAVREFLFPYSEDKKMPLKMDVEFNDNGTHQYWFMVYRNDGAYIGNTYTFNQNYNSEQVITEGNNKSKLVTSAPGNYKFTLTYHDNGSGTVNYYIDVDFPIAKDDYRIVYKDNAKWSQSTAHSPSWYHPSDVINKIAGDATEDKKDIVSFYVAHGSTISMKFQYASNITDAGVVTWTDVTGGTIDLSAFSSVITKPGVYNFHVTQAVGGGISVEKVEPYTGNYYIRTDCAGNTKWDSYKSLDHQMTYTEFSSRRSTNTFGELFTHYYTHWCERGSNIKFVIANDYSPCISDTLAQDIPDTYSNTDAAGTLKTDGATLPVNDRYSANVRFMYNDSTNKISRAYVASSTDHSRLFLVLRGNNEVRGDDNLPISDQDITNGVIMDDTQNWIYERTLRILPGTRFKLFACYAKATPTEEEAQYFRGAYDSDNFTTDANSVILVDGNPSVGYQNVRVVYDFKTNRLVCAWLPDNSAIDGTLPIHADVMIIREHQEAAKQITFTNNPESKLSDVLTVYGTMKFNRWVLNNKSSADGHAVLPLESQKSIFERALYFISFPFDVNLGEVFGFGTYGVHWIIENYDGESRAKNGYWKDSPPNWKYITNPKGYVLEANKGYILCLDLDLMKDDNEEFWPHGINTVELFFPSAVAQSTIEQQNVTIPAPDPNVYQCTINRSGPDGDRRIKDSYWRCLGVPSFANYTTTLSNGTSTITWQTTDNTLPYLYAWNMENNTLTAQSTSTFAFKTMHAYLTQCATAIIWSAASKPTPIAARRSDNEVLSDREFRLELAENGEKKDQTYVRLSMDETVTAGFEFGNDLSKELNSGVSNIYTLIGYELAAANSLPLSTEQTTVVRVGVVANANGDYTISLPDGTDGVGVTLIDNETGVRTSLSALDYTVTLEKGTYDDRFVLEISPIQQTPTGVDEVQNDKVQGTKVRKVLIDQKMYILRDGKMYDARGALITL